MALFRFRGAGLGRKARHHCGSNDGREFGEFCVEGGGASRTRGGEGGGRELGWGGVGRGGGEAAVPAVLAGLLNSHDATRGTVIRSGIAEHETALPPGTHGPRCHDLALFAEQGQSAVTICVEAKADEAFGATVADELRNAEKRPVTTSAAGLAYA